MAAAGAVETTGSTAAAALHLAAYNPPKLWQPGAVKAAENVVAPARQAAPRALERSGDGLGVVRCLLLAWELMDKNVKNDLTNTQHGKGVRG